MVLFRIMPLLPGWNPRVEGADEAGLKRGAGHVLGTGYPGTETNCAPAAHRDTVFRSLKEIRKGDLITFSTSKTSFQDYVTGMEMSAQKKLGCRFRKEPQR